MPSLIRSNSAFAAGDLVLQSHNFSVADDGFVSARFNFACLGTPQVVARNMRLFEPDAPLPITLPNDLAALPLETRQVYCLNTDSHIASGICYIVAEYVGSSANQSRRIEETWTSRTFTGEILASLGFFSAGATTGILGVVSFDYMAVSRSVKWTTIAAGGDVALSAAPTNIRNLRETLNTGSTEFVGIGGGGSFGGSVFRLGPGYMVQPLVSLRATKVGRVTRLEKTVTGEYVSDNDGTRIIRPDQDATVLTIEPPTIG
jgi:hypothetical protein